jgi:hypothetical protein
MTSRLLLSLSCVLCACATLPREVRGSSPLAEVSEVRLEPASSVTSAPEHPGGGAGVPVSVELSAEVADEPAPPAPPVQAAPEVADESELEADAAGEPEKPASAGAAWRYTADLSDEELARRWKDDPASLGSISVGRPDEGRMINAMPFPEPPEGGPWVVVLPESCWTTQETADAIIGAARQLREWFPDGAPVRVGQVSGPEGGYLPPHRSHQNGRDVDIGLFYPGPEPHRVVAREKVMDVPMNWAFAKAMLMHGDVQYILLDYRVQKVLYDYALKHGENKAWLDSLFHGERRIFRHARKHRDHFHVRLYNARAQELAYRLAPLMPARPEENLALHRVVKGDTLGGLAHRFGSTVATLKLVNRLTSNALRVGQVLKVPLRGPCTSCPVPRLVVVPPRRVPPPPATSSVTRPPDSRPRG